MAWLRYICRAIFSKFSENGSNDGALIAGLREVTDGGEYFLFSWVYGTELHAIICGYGAGGGGGDGVLSIDLSFYCLHGIRCRAG